METRGSTQDECDISCRVSFYPFVGACGAGGPKRAVPGLHTVPASANARLRSIPGTPASAPASISVPDSSA